MDNISECILWSNQDFTLRLFKEDSRGYRFEFKRLSKRQCPATIIAAWIQEKLKTPENIFVFENDSRQGPSLDIIWNSDHSVCRDMVSSEEGFQGCSTVLDVGFVICIVHVIWSFGLLLISEEFLDNLHIFSTTNSRYLGYLTLHRNSRDSIWIDRHTAAIWCLVRKYDNLTRTRTTHLNCYRLPGFQLFSNFPMPPGFSSYQFVKLRENPERKTLLSTSTNTLILCANPLIPNYRLLHFVGPKRPYFKQEFQNHDSLPQVMLRNNYGATNWKDLI